jgi:HrpA-like RNA helicase
LVFRPGRGEVEETAAAIRALLGDEVEVAEIYGELDSVRRKAAVAAPAADQVKVLVGTNVVESGANIPWLDSGVSCGTGKELSVRPETGATYLGLINLPRWRLDQQEGRVKRFCPGVFVLCSPLAYGERPAETTPEIKRLTLTELVLHCAGFGIRAEELVFDYAPEQARIVEAETKLQQLGLIDVNCRLTQAGRFVSGMPVGPETGALLWYAKETGVLGAALMLAAVVEVGGVRKDFKSPHHVDNSSDWLDGYKAFRLVYEERDTTERKKLMGRYNVGFKRFDAAKDMYRDLLRRFNGETQHTTFATDIALRRCLVAGFITDIFQGTFALRPLQGGGWTTYNLGNGSAAYLHSGFALGQLRTIQPKDPAKTKFTVVEKVTNVSLDDIMAVVKVRPSVVVVSERREEVGFMRFETVVTRKLFGVYELPVERYESPLSKEEEKALAAHQLQRRQYEQRLEKLSERRVRAGLMAVRMGDSVFYMDYTTGAYSYSAEDIARAETATDAQVAAAKNDALQRAREAAQAAKVAAAQREQVRQQLAPALDDLVKHFSKR